MMAGLRKWAAGCGKLNRGLYIEQQLTLHLLGALIFQPGELVAASVVDQHIQPLFQCRVLQQTGPFLVGSQIGDHCLVAFRMGQLFAEAIQHAGSAAVQQQVCPLRRQLLGQRFAYPAACAREQHSLSLQFHRVGVPVP